MHAKLLQLCSNLCDPMDHSLPDFSVHKMLQAEILGWAAIPFSRGSSWPRDWPTPLMPTCIGRQILYHLSPQRLLETKLKIWQHIAIVWKKKIVLQIYRNKIGMKIINFALWQLYIVYTNYAAIEIQEREWKIKIILDIPSAIKHAERLELS